MPAISSRRRIDDARRAEQHRDVTVVAAGVHVPGVCERYGTSFSSSIGSASMSARSMIVLPGARAAHDADDAGPPDPVVDLEAERAQPRGDERGGAVFLEAQFGVLVQIAADRDDLGDDLRRNGDGQARGIARAASRRRGWSGGAR